jgi:hypothetical protein
MKPSARLESCALNSQSLGYNRSRNMETLTEPNSLEQEPEHKRMSFWRNVHVCWVKCRQFLRLLKICRFSLFFAIAIPAVFIWNEQASEVLRCLAEGHADGSATGQYQFLFFYMGMVSFSLAVWYFSRVLLYFRYPGMKTENSWTMGTRQILPRVLGTIPPVGMAMAFWLASRPYGPDDSPKAILYWYPGFCLGTAVALLVFFLKRHDWFGRGGSSREIASRRFPRELSWPTWFAIYTVWFLSFALFISFLIWPVGLPRLMGTGAVIFFACATWICMGSVLVYYGSHLEVPFIGIALGLAVVFSVWNDNHQIRTLPQKTPAQRILLVNHFTNFMGRLEQRFPKEARRPVFVVTAEGGGIRAAFWSASVLAALQEENTNFAAHVFGISGVSGGSLGAVVFNGLLACNRPNLVEDAQTILAQDHLSPTIAYMVLPDLLQRFWPFPIKALDRAQALEMAWEAAWKDHCSSDILNQSFADLWKMRPDLPDLYLNGTSVEYGKRIITSNVRFDERDFADSISAYEKLEGDLRLSTAAHMSARFTYVSPAGEFPDRQHIVDGGYFENSGAATAKDLIDIAANAAADNVDLYVIRISNSPTEVSSEVTPEEQEEVRKREIMGESLSPVYTLLHTRSARGSYSELVLASSSAVKQLFVFKLLATSTPLPLGWQLSGKAAGEMSKQLSDQRDVIREIGKILPKQ